MMLKPQDIVVLVKLCSYPPDLKPSFAQIAMDLHLSASEVHGAVRRARIARLLSPRDLGSRPNIRALEEFLIHGVKYVFPAERGEPTRGVPTAYAAPPLNTLIGPVDELPPVWPYPTGDTRGVAFEPLYKTVPYAALHDSFLYECLALVDAIRDGRVRERKLAEEELKSRLRSCGSHERSGKSRPTS